MGLRKVRVTREGTERYLMLCRWYVLALVLTPACNEPDDVAAGKVAQSAEAARSRGHPVAVASAVSAYGPWVFATPNPRLAAAYFELRNSGKDDQILLSVSSDVAARAELHESVEKNGMVSMVPHPKGFLVPAGGGLELARGAKHVMLIDLKKPLEAGDEVTLQLMLSSGAVITLKAPVRDVTQDRND